MNPFDFHFHEDTPQAVREVLAEAYEAGTRLRLHLGAAGNVWLEECDVIGRIGRSTGLQKVPLLLATKRSTGGIHILDHCILRIQAVKTGRDLYRATSYIAPQFTVLSQQDGVSTVHRAYPSGAWEFVASFSSPVKAEHWIKFMTGDRFSPN